MIRQTSLEAFHLHAIKLQKMETEVFEMICKCPLGITNSEISQALSLPINCITGRTRGLVKKDVVKKLETRPDSYTGNTSIAWVVNDEKKSRVII